MSAYQKARIFDPDSPTDVFYVQFNPNTLEYSASLDRKTHKRVKKPGGSGGQRERESQGPLLGKEREARLSVRLFFHSYISDGVFSNVRPYVNRIRAFLPATSGRQATSKKMTFAWGTLTHTGTLESFQVTYQMFAFDGTPVQAEVAITIQGEDPDISAASNNQALRVVPATDSSPQDDALLPSDLSWLFQ